jgi:hypothetical protein
MKVVIYCLSIEFVALFVKMNVILGIHVSLDTVRASEGGKNIDHIGCIDARFLSDFWDELWEPAINDTGLEIVDQLFFSQNLFCTVDRGRDNQLNYGLRLPTLDALD